MKMKMNNITNWFDNRRYWGTDRNPFLQKIKYYGVVNYLVTRLANIILPIYFKLTSKSTNNKLTTNPEREQKLIVSLTSYSVRLSTLWLVIECLLRQNLKPDKIVLYLTESQVGDIEKLPQSLLRLRKRGLEIRLCKEEIRSHTKYYPAFQDFPNDIVITVDDDLFYRTDLLENLMKHHLQYPQCIIANWVKEIKAATPFYTEWPEIQTPSISNHFLLFGVGGVLYPPHCMYKDIFNVKQIKELCLTADDIWLTCMALMAHTPIYFTGYRYNYLPINIKNNTTLISVNRERNQVCINNLNSYYQKELGIRPFIDLIQQEETK